jgi:hypothetical protein
VARQQRSGDRCAARPAGAATGACAAAAVVGWRRRAPGGSIPGGVNAVTRDRAGSLPSPRGRASGVSWRCSAPVYLNRQSTRRTLCIHDTCPFSCSRVSWLAALKVAADRAGAREPWARVDRWAPAARRCRQPAAARAAAVLGRAVWMAERRCKGAAASSEAAVAPLWASTAVRKMAAAAAARRLAVASQVPHAATATAAVAAGVACRGSAWLQVESASAWAAACAMPEPAVAAAVRACPVAEAIRRPAFALRQGPAAMRAAAPSVADWASPAVPARAAARASATPGTPSAVQTTSVWPAACRAVPAVLATCATARAVAMAVCAPPKDVHVAPAQGLVRRAAAPAAAARANLAAGTSATTVCCARPGHAARAVAWARPAARGPWPRARPA